MNRLFTCLAFTIALTSVACAEDTTIPLASGGLTDYVITLPDEPTLVQETAASELQYFLGEATGADWPIIAESDASNDVSQIVIGPSARMSELAPEADVQLATLSDDGILIQTVGRNLILAGSGARGPLYAVYTFLEETVGCRWWTSTESTIPSRPDLSIPTLNVCYSPKLIYREAFYRDAMDGVFAARMKCNGHHHRVTPEYGGRHRFVGFVHTFYPFLPPERYFEEHPDWYSEINGTRKHDHGQLCLANDAMREEFVRVCLEKLRAEPEGGFISVSQNDWHGRCECEACSALEETEGSPSGPLLHFVNAVAEAIEPEFPDVWVETLAYQYTRTPPQHVRPRGNVVIRLCSIECSFVQTLGEGPQNETFRADTEGWSQVAPNLFVWNYVTNFSNYMVPHPNMRVVAPNLRYYVDHGTIGIFEQGDSQCGVGDFVRLRAWVIAHLMWDPNSDEHALRQEFLEGYYGPAATHLADYLDLIHDRGEASGVYLRCFMTDTSSWLRLEDLNRATELFDQAEAAVKDDPILAARVERDRLTLDHVWLRRYSTLHREATLRGLPFNGPDDPAAACEEFLQLCRDWNVGNWRERIPFEDYADGLEGRFSRPAPTPPMCEGRPASEWIDFQEFDFRLASYGTYATIEEDGDASNGRTVRMPGEHHEWACQVPLSDDFDSFGGNEGAWRCYASVRCEGPAESGPAVRLGIYDAINRHGIAQQDIDATECRDGYVWVDLGVHELKSGDYFYAAPTNRPGEIDAVYVDRIVIIRDDS
jgi:hypothetical protein